ncbi:MAG: alpha/beta hydrolase [Planctomycetota bacterium]
MDAPPPHPPDRRNLVYAELTGQQLLLDLYRPDTQRPAPVVVYFHSGGWRAGSKDACKLQWLTRYGFAVASVNYRLLPRYRFPTQVHDAKAAVRFLRAHADTFGLHPEQFVAAGLSSGAYLACMLGLTAGHVGLEAPPNLPADTPPAVPAPHPPLVSGDAAPHHHPAGDTTPPHPGLPGQRNLYLETPSHVQAVVNYAAMTNFISLQDLASRRGSLAQRSPEAQFLGHAVRENLDRVRLANPLDHIHPDAPPFLHLHGDRNDVTPIDQTRKFHEALQNQGVTSKFILVRGAGHNSRRLTDHPSIRDRVADFLHRHLGTEGGMRAVFEENKPRQDE